MLKKQFNKLRFEWRNLNEELKSIKKIQEVALPLFTSEVSKHLDLNALKSKEQKVDGLILPHESYESITKQLTNNFSICSNV